MAQRKIVPNARPTLPSGSEIKKIKMKLKRMAQRCQSSELTVCTKKITLRQTKTDILQLSKSSCYSKVCRVAVILLSKYWTHHFCMAQCCTAMPEVKWNWCVWPSVVKAHYQLFLVVIIFYACSDFVWVAFHDKALLKILNKIEYSLLNEKLYRSLCSHVYI